MMTKSMMMAMTMKNMTKMMTMMRMTKRIIITGADAVTVKMA